MIINKTINFEDLKSEKALTVINELNRLVKDMKRRNVKISKIANHKVILTANCCVRKNADEYKT